MTDQDRTPVAGILVTKCTRCKLELNHVVLAHNREGIVERVKCNTCGSEHKYHPEKKKETTKKTGRVTRKKVKDHTKTFDALSERFRDKPPQPYSMSGLFQEDDVIDHQTFGRGYVTGTTNDKMEVLFSEGPRTLVYNR